MSLANHLLLDFEDRVGPTRMFFIRTLKLGSSARTVPMKRQVNQRGDPKNIVGPKIRMARLAFNPPITQDELSGRLARRQLILDRVAITKIENRQRCVFDFELVALAKALNVTVAWLLNERSDKGEGA